MSKEFGHICGIIVYRRCTLIKIIEYQEKYLEDVRDLLVELEEYIVSIDKDNLDQVHEEYREKMALIDLKEVNDENGKCFLAVENDKPIR